MKLESSKRMASAIAKARHTGAYGDGVVRPYAEKAKRLLRMREAPEDNSPTPERRAKEPSLVQRGRVVGLKEDVAERHYRSAPPAETYNGKFTAEVEAAFGRFVYESQVCAEAYSRKLVMNYDATGGGAPHNRMGGLGHAPQKIREIEETHQRLRRSLPGLNMGKVLDIVLLGTRAESTGKMMTFADVGHVLFPHIRDKAMGKGIGLGYLIAAGEVLVQRYHHLDMERKERERAHKRARDHISIMERS